MDRSNIFKLIADLLEQSSGQDGRSRQELDNALVVLRGKDIFCEESAAAYALLHPSVKIALQFERVLSNVYNRAKEDARIEILMEVESKYKQLCDEPQVVMPSVFDTPHIRFSADDFM